MLRAVLRIEAGITSTLEDRCRMRLDNFGLCGRASDTYATRYFTLNDQELVHAPRGMENCLTAALL